MLLVLTGACGGGEGDPGPDPDPVPGRGRLAFNWSLLAEQQAASCLDVGAVTVAVTAIRPGQLVGEADSFSCGAGFAETRNLTPGTYSVTLDLLASGSRSLLDEPLAIAGILVAPGEVADPRDIEFSVEPVGAVTWSMSVAGYDGNCAAEQGNVESIALEIQTLEGMCVPTMFRVGDGALASHDCVGEFTVPCVEAGTTVTAEAVPSGPHQLEIDARRPGPLSCFSRTAQFPVPGNGLEVALGPLMLPVDSNPGCAP